MKRHTKVEKTKQAITQRIEKRPSPDDWKDDELMTLPEAAALFWPEGPLTTTSLRTAVRDRQLDVAIIAGKFLTTKTAILRMSACKPLDENETAEVDEEDDLPQPRSVAELRRRIAQGSR